MFTSIYRASSFVFVLCMLFHIQILQLLYDLIPVLLFKQQESEQKKLNVPLNVAVILYLKLLNLKLISQQWLVCCNDHNKEMVLIKSRQGLWPAVLHVRQDHSKMIKYPPHPRQTNKNS